MSMFKSWRIIAIVLAIPLFAGCASISTNNAPTAPVNKPAFKEFTAAKPGSKEREALKAKYAAEKRDSYEYQQMLYTGGDKVCNDDSSLCKTFDPQTLKVTFWWMNKEVWGTDTVIIGSFQADQNGIPVGPAQLQTAASATGFGRDQLARAWGVLASASQGTIPMLLQLSKCEGGNCGSSSGVGDIIIGVSSGSLSESNQTSNLAAGCGPAGCSAPAAQ